MEWTYCATSAGDRTVFHALHFGYEGHQALELGGSSAHMNLWGFRYLLVVTRR